MQSLPQWPVMLHGQLVRHVSGRLGKVLAQSRQQPAESVFAVSIAHRPIDTQRQCLPTLKLPIVSIAPGSAPHLPGKGVSIRQPYPTHIGLTDMADDNMRLDWIIGNQPCNRRTHRRVRIAEIAVTAGFIEGDSPAVTMRPGTTTTVQKTGKTETDIRWHVGTHAQQLTHALFLVYSRFTFMVLRTQPFMAFHNPDPKIRALEQRNARSRAALFRKL